MRQCLFSAPHDFLPDELIHGYRTTMSTRFHEVWELADLPEVGDVAAWIPNPGQSFVVNEGVLDRFPSLSTLITPSTGMTHVDREACEARAVRIFSLLDDREGLESISASAEFTFLLVLNTLRRLDFAVAEVSAGRWRQRENLLRGHELEGKRVGLVGMGRIGRRLAKYCLAFGASVAYFDPYVGEIEHRSITIEEVFHSSDVVCICCALTTETECMIGYELLETLPLGACLVNSSRGEVLVEEDLIRFLRTRRDVRVSLDVLSGESRGAHLSSRLLELHRHGQIVITPHIAGATVESQTKAATIALHLLRRHTG